MPPWGWRPFLGENRGGCPLTPDVLGRRRPLISRVLGAALWALHCRLEHADQIRLLPCGSCGRPPVGRRAQGGWGAGGEAGDRGDHPAGSRLGYRQGRADLLCAGAQPRQARPAGAGGSDLQDDDPVATGHGRPAGRVGRDPGGLEATSDYWKGVFYLLEAHGYETWLVNARDVKHLPGRPKTDTLDAVWLCKVAERQMVRPSFVPPRGIRQLRDVTRYRADLVGVRTAEKQRVEKLLEDAQIKLSVVASDIFGVSGRAMLAALIAGERDPKVLAQLARTRLRAKLGPLAEAFTGFFTDQHAFLLAKMLGRVDALDADLAELDAKLQELITPFTDAVDRLDEIPGVGQLAAHLLLAELGADMTRFPTAGHLVSWATFAPGVKAR